MSDNKHGRVFGGKGYYIALVLCAAAIGIMSYVYYAGAETEAVQTANVPSDLVGTATLPTTGTAPTGGTEPGGPSTKPTAGKLSVCAPVQGEVLMPYAMEVLSYNQTTRDWRVHNGVDFAAPAGTPVVAAADGQVYTVYEDDQMGMTVVIRHADGYTTKYSSLFRSRRQRGPGCDHGPDHRRGGQHRPDGKRPGGPCPFCRHQRRQKRGPPGISEVDRFFILSSLLWACCEDHSRPLFCGQKRI